MANFFTIDVVDPSSTVAALVTTTVIHLAGLSSSIQSTMLAVQSTMTPLATLTDVQPTVEEPVVLLASLMIVGWSLFLITLFLFIVSLITWFCKSRRRKK